MKRTTMNLMLATAALLVASTVASAQTISFEIPFAFQVAGKIMAPGAYDVSASPGESLFQITSKRSGHALLLSSGTPQDPQSAWVKAGGGLLEFACDEGGCSLKRIWTGTGAPAHAYATPKREGDKPTHLAVVRTVAGKAGWHTPSELIAVSSQ
jgi:hypothetical protein